MEKKLAFNKVTVATLSKQQQTKLAGGLASWNCETYDPQYTCESNPRPTYVCM